MKRKYEKYAFFYVKKSEKRFAETNFLHILVVCFWRSFSFLLLFDLFLFFLFVFFPNSAFASRLFSVIRYESVIHEFDPYFNYRSTKYLVNEGFYNFHNWFDEQSWYPLGRITGGTIYPGLMITSALLYWALHAIKLTVDIRNVCVMLAPFMASNTAVVAYGLAKEVSDNASAGLVAAAFISVVPGYISRSVAGSYDNEGVAIFALLLAFYAWVKAIKSGSLLWSGLAALAYFYMVSAWGGYIFIINLIPLHVLVLILSGRYSSRVYVSYSAFYVLGTLLSMQIPFVGFNPVKTSEHMAAFGVFGLLQLYAFVNLIRSLLPTESQRIIFRYVFGILLAVLSIVLVIARLLGYIKQWTGRFYSLLDPTYAKEHIPIIASVSEHQPTTWSSFYFDLHALVFLFPAGFYFCFKRLSDANIFIILYGVLSVYFAGVMVRLMLVLAPVCCVLGAIAVTNTYETYLSQLFLNAKPSKKVSTKKSSSSEDEAGSFPKLISVAFIVGLTLLLCFYQLHCSWVTSEAYSSPSIVLSARSQDGGRIIFDDFRESYYWLRHNTAEDAKVMSWWDYGYQIVAMANRTILVDNNTWNNTHIATVGKAMASTEEKAYEIMRRLDVDYVLVLFGGLTGYSSDDINKFLWMVRIGGGVYPEIKEKDYFTPGGDYRVDKSGSPIMLNSLMYKMCYYKFGSIVTEYGQPSGFDRVRSYEIGNKDFELEYLEEAFTSEHWLVRIYKVKQPDNRP